MYQPELTYSPRPRSGKRLSTSRRIVFALLKQIEGAGLHLHDPHLGSRFFGNPQAELQAEIRVNHSRTYRRILLGGSIAAAETYMDGEWNTPDLTAVIQTLAINDSVLNKLGSRFSRVAALLNKCRHLLHRNSVSQAKKNIAAHYDLGNDFYRSFLDESMLYSSGWYALPEMSLAEAQQAKMRRLCGRLQLTSHDHLLEIGTGWGAMAEFAAREYGCRVTTTTISQEQYDYSCRRIAAAGLADRVTVLKQDYRQLNGQYDKLVSVEMIEAVGQQYIPLFFARCRDLLKPDGRLALQAITISEARFARYARSVDFIQRYIFPGGFLPAVSMLEANLTASRFTLHNLFEIGPDYARTLRAWRLRYEAAMPQLQNAHFDSHFHRMWRFYLCYCEAGFLAGTIGTVQLTAQKNENA